MTLSSRSTRRLLAGVAAAALLARPAAAGEVEARRAHLELLPIHEAMFLEANPGPVKAALAMAPGPVTMTDAVRGPLVKVSEATRKTLAALLAERVGRG